MLNEHQINMLPERIYQRLAKMNTEYLTSIGEVIKKIGELRPTDVHRLQQMYNYGADVNRLVNSLSAMSSKNVAEIYDIFDIVAKENYNFAKPFYKAKGMPFIPFEENESLQKYVKAIAKQTAGQYVNLTQHTAFSVFAKDGKSIAPLFASNKHKVATSLSDTYTKVIDYAVSKVQLGGESYNKAMKDVIKALASSGIKTVDYASGYSRRLDSAVRQNILWGIKECNQNTADMVGKEFGADGYEISYHSNPRPSHVAMGGRQYAIGKARTINGIHYPSFEKEAEPFLNEPNCLHFKFSILLGISQSAHNKDQLEQFKANDKKTFEFEGKKYTGYEGTQLQRKIENTVKNNKDLLDAAKAAGNKELEREAREKINLLTSKYHQLSKASGLPTKMDRMSTFRTKSVDKSAKSGYNNFARNVSGARITDLYSKEAEIFANSYYEEIRHFSTDIKHISDNLGIDYDRIKKVKDYLFIENSKFDEETGRWVRFDPDCAVAHSWQRLMLGKDIKPHDRTLIYHELYEMEIKKGNKEISHLEAHKIASQKYNYQKEAEEYYANLAKYKEIK